MTILLTGGAGYIGTHTAIALLEAGHEVVIADNLANSSKEAVSRVERITDHKIPFYAIDVSDRPSLEKVFTDHAVDAVIHFAGLKAVGESVEKPLLYYRNNLDSTLTLLEVMQQFSTKKIVFSSSATVYGTPDQLPLTETSPVGIGITNPYGFTKYVIERILTDAASADPELEVTILRYFNPVGAHSSGLIGEDPHGPPNNLLPFIAQTAVGKREFVGVFGDDYDTPDGTGVRDYIHVVDLAAGHLAALEYSQKAVKIYNLGTGHGTSVLEAIAAFSSACGHDVPYRILPRRPGDIASCYASVQKAADELDWRAQKTFAEACEDAWRWQSNNPNGYEEES